MALRFLLAAVVGSGIMAERHSDGNEAIALGLGNVPAFVIFQVLGAGLALMADKALRENP